MPANNITDRLKRFSMYFRITDTDSEIWELFLITLQMLKIREIRIAGIPDFRNSEFPDIRIAGIPDFRNSEFPDIRISGIPDIRNYGFPEIRISGFPEFRISGNPDFRICGFPETTDIRNAGNPDI